MGLFPSGFILKSLSLIESSQLFAYISDSQNGIRQGSQEQSLFQAIPS